MLTLKERMRQDTVEVEGPNKQRGKGNEWADSGVGASESVRGGALSLTPGGLHGQS